MKASAGVHTYSSKRLRGLAAVPRCERCREREMIKEAEREGERGRRIELKNGIK